MKSEVFNLANASAEAVAEYDLPPREAVRNAYAQLGLGDYETWNYAAKYDHLVEEGRFTVLCGDYSCWKEGKRPSFAEFKQWHESLRAGKFEGS